MAGGYKNIKDQPNHNTQGFKQNPQNIGKPVGWRHIIRKVTNEDGIIYLERDQVEYDRSKKKYRVTLPGKERIVIALQKKAQQGDTRAASFLADREEGKPHQTKEITKRVAPTAIKIGFDPPDNCPHCNKSLIDDT